LSCMQFNSMRSMKQDPKMLMVDSSIWNFAKVLFSCADKWSGNAPSMWWKRMHRWCTNAILGIMLIKCHSVFAFVMLKAMKDYWKETPFCRFGYQRVMSLIIGWTFYLTLMVRSHGFLRGTFKNKSFFCWDGIHKLIVWMHHVQSFEFDLVPWQICSQFCVMPSFVLWATK
jgi:hypothetical protein